MKLHFTNEWLRRKIASDPDDMDIEAGSQGAIGMSYSFGARGTTKTEVMQKVAAELDKVVIAQPIHSADRAQAMTTADVFLRILPDSLPDDKDFYVSVSGSLGWNGLLGSADCVVTSASVNVSAYMTGKEKA